MAAYVRKKRVGQYEYYQVVESRRVEGEPRQKVLVHLGRQSTVDDALKQWPREIKRLRRHAQEDRDMVPRGSETRPAYRDMLKRAASWEKRADDLESNLKKLRELRKEDGV
jgi:predicted  nucleic acid-binding Zn-ribbon protein